MSVIYLIRHGQASFGQENYDRLSDVGVQQAELLGGYFCSIRVRFDSVYSGSLVRQMDTAKGVLSKLSKSAKAGTLNILSEFDEFTTYSAYMNQLAEMTANDPALSEMVGAMSADRNTFREGSDKLLQRWRSTKSSSSVMDSLSDSWKAFGQRVQTGFEKVRADNGPGKQVAVFTSGGTISAAMQLALELSDEQTIGLPGVIRNTSISTFLYDETRFSLSSFNAVPHLDLQNDPGLITVL
jgi:broad specificity phosphatase PhoE